MSNIYNLIDTLEEKGQKLSKARKVRSLLEMQKSLIKKKQSLTDFEEPVLFLVRRNGDMDMFEKATAGKFVYEHTSGKPRFLELRPSDQVKFSYGDKKVRGYVAHEDRPFAGWDEPIVDSETVMLGYEKTKATDLKYQQKIEELKNKAKMTWVWVILAILIGFGIMAVLVPSEVWDRMLKTGKYAVQEPATTGSLITLGFRKLGFKSKA